MPSSFHLVPGTYSVTSYGATGDGTTDDTAAIQATIDAVASAGGGIVYFPPGIYLVSHLTLPARGISSLPMIPIGLAGPSIPSFCPSVIGAIALPVAGAILKSTATSGGGILKATSVSGDPVGYTFTMLNVTIENLTFRTYNNPSIPAVDLSNVACCRISNVTADTGLYSTSSISLPTTSGAAAFKLPEVQNGAFTHVDSALALGYYSGFDLGEHAVCLNINAFGCRYAARTGAQNHAIWISRLLDVHCQNGIQFTGGARLDVTQWATEIYVTSGTWQDRVYDVVDPSNHGKGQARYAVVQSVVGPVSTFTKSGGSNFTCTNIGN